MVYVCLLSDKDVLLFGLKVFESESFLTRCFTTIVDLFAYFLQLNSYVTLPTKIIHASTIVSYRKISGMAYDLFYMLFVYIGRVRGYYLIIA